MIDERYCSHVGTPAQHRYVCRLASSFGYTRLRDAVADATGMSVSRCGRATITIAMASEIIDWLIEHRKTTKPRSQGAKEER